MRNRNILLVGAVVLILGASLLYLLRTTVLRPRPTASFIDNKGIYIGSARSGLEPSVDDASQFARTVNGLNEGWNNIRAGNSYYQTGHYEEAVLAYKKAYEVDSGNRIFSGKKLINAYEKLSQYDEALAVTENILKTQPLGDIGIKRFEEIRTHLLTAKNQIPDNSANFTQPNVNKHNRRRYSQSHA